MEPEKILRYCQGLCTPEEQVEIEKTAENSEELRETIQNLRVSLALQNDILAMESIDMQAGYNRIQSKIRNRQNTELKNRRHSALRRVSIYAMRYAAILSIPLLISSLLFGYLYFSSISQEVQYAEVNTTSGAIIRYELPDKSVVWLNSGSKLRYPTVFKGDKRVVELDGEGYFEVQADKKHPFYVNTPKGLNVYVYGTHFNVNAYKEDNYVEAVLEEGKVNVVVPGQEEEVKLEPGERAYYDLKTMQISKTKTDIYEKTAWRAGKLIFRNASLKDVLKKLSRHFNVDIQFTNLTGKDFKYRATFTTETLNQILDYLSKSASIKWVAQESVQQKDASFSQKIIILTLYK